MFSARSIAVLGLGALAAAGAVHAQAGAEGGGEAPPVRVTSRVALPEIDFYFPEGDLDLRLNRLVKNAFFQGQVRYNFVKGDILALLRYRYYAHDRIWQIGVFDEINFDRIEQLSNDFQRSRGGLVQVEIPQTINRRAFFLAEVDRLTSNKEEQVFSTDRTNTFVRVGYQIGTPDDSRSNAIVGESRSRVERLFSAYRNIGPGGFGLTGALTWSFDDLGGEFSYLRLETEGLKRWQGRSGRFAITRLHLGAFPASDTVRPEEPDPEDRLSVPLDELFRLDGRERLKGLDEELYGTDEIHATVEWFLPWFTDGDRLALRARWENWYWVAYAGAGNVGFEGSVFTDWGDYVADVGVGFESSFRVGRYVFFLSALAAHALDDRGGFKGRLTLKSSNR
ncbi:MAG: hypothetical protein F9K16_10330 [Thermoanaerobaculia bacterium]|nr:MAG: hypothetical protein F9K16_10330 [Thermoanaerobaculia bacterium]